MKRYFLLFFLYSFTYSQELPKFTPPSPTAYELGKYGEIPIGLFTGSPNVSVPLLEFKTRDLTIPITLGYSSNGIKVDQLETKVGLGWVINTGGIISRTTKNGPDELRTYKHPPVINENYRSSEFIDFYNTVIDGSKLDDASASLVYDSEPDIFNFNFLGRSGRFTFNNDGKIVLLSDFSLKIAFNPEGSGGFLIIDEQGVKYYFNEIEESRLDTTGDNGYSHMGAFSTTSWSMSKIIMPDNDIINFNYANEIYNYVTAQEQSLRSLYVNYPVSNVSDDYCHHPANAAYEGPLTNQNLNIRGKRILSISSNNLMYGTISFEYNTAHPQVANYNMLSAITLKNNLNNVVEKANFSYSAVAQRMFLNQVSLLDPNKKYNFEYINLPYLPQRLSFSKDRWGYNNGISTNVKLYPNLSGLNKTIENYFNELFPNGANRNLDETKAKAGLLQKVIYPTRGSSEFEYESNDYPTSESISTMSTATLQVSTTPQDPLYGEKATTLTLPNLAESYTGPLKISFGINYPVCYSSSSSPYDRKLFIEITNLTNPQDNNMISLTGQPLGIQSNNIIITENDVNMNKYIVRLSKNNSYRIKIRLFYQCLKGELKFDYPSSGAQVVFFNKKTGGLRISKVINKEASGNILSSKKYFYARKDYLTMSSGTLPRPENYISYSYDSGLCTTDQTMTLWTLTYRNLNSNDLAYKYLPEFQHTRYEYVTVSDTDDQFANGGIEYKHKVNTLQQMSPEAIVFGSFLEAFPENEYSWGDGLNLETTTFKKVPSGFKTVKKEIYNYQRDSRINEIIHGFKLEKKWDIFFSGGPLTPLAIAEQELNVTRYDIITNWNYLSSKTEQLFDTNGLNPVETVTNYFYDNPLHCQLTRTITNNSKGVPIITKNYYPDDVVTINSLGLETLSIDTYGAFNKLKTQTVSNPNSLHQNGIVLQTETYSDANNDGVANNNELLNVNRTNYKDWGNNNVLPEKIQTLKGVYDGNANVLQDRIQFYSYYDDGRIKELSQKGGSHIVYIWGYNQTQPIAKIENATNAQVATALGVSDVSALNESNLAAINALRSNASFANTMITTYTHIPLIGVSTITDPKGDKTTFVYDSFGRLETVKDKNDNILTENQYNYKP